MLDREKVLSNLKYADMVEDKAKGFSAEADRVKKMYWDLREIRDTAVPDLPWEYVEKMASWTNLTLAKLGKKRQRSGTTSTQSGTTATPTVRTKMTGLGPS